MYPSRYVIFAGYAYLYVGMKNFLFHSYITEMLILNSYRMRPIFNAYGLKYTKL